MYELKNRIGIPATIKTVRTKKETTMKFELQNPHNTKRTTKINADDRTTCCGSEVMYFEPDYDNPLLGGYEGCEFCGAVAGTFVQLTERDEQMISDEWLFAYGKDFDGKMVSNAARKSHAAFRAAFIAQEFECAE